MNNQPPRIVVTGRIPESGIERLQAAGEVWNWTSDDPIPVDVRDAQLAHADAAVTLLSDRVDDRFLAAAPHLGIVANVAVGYNNIDVAAATKAGVMATNHRAYAEAIAGATGISAGAADPELVADNLDAFTGSTTEALTAAHALEQTAVATNTALIAEYESNTAIALTASIAVVEARHATVIADMLGVDDLDVLFGNDQSPLELTGDDA